MMHSPRLWPVIILLSAIAAGIVNFIAPDMAGRPLIVMWFLFVCPGMALVRFLCDDTPAVQWTLAIALSLTLDAIVAGVLLYAGKWSIGASLAVIMALSIVGAIAQLARPHFSFARSSSC
jgi:hypothetical protein